jgi:hypothetical protein
LWIAAGVTMLALAGGWWWWQQNSASPQADALPASEAVVALPTPIDTAKEEGASLAELLDGRSDDWRVARLAANPKILVIEFPNLKVQGETLNRLGALVEKRKAPRDRVLDDQGLAQLIKQSGDTTASFYFGHDYPGEAVARFFTLAVNQQVRLNADEMRLGNLLIFVKFLREESDRLVAASERQALVSFTAVQADDPTTPGDETVDALRREAVLMHELSHGEFFTNTAYRDHCWRFWRGLADEERDWFRAFLSRLDYDPRNEELMVNEAQAFLMHTPDRRAFSAQTFGIPNARMEAMRARFREGMPPTIFSQLGPAVPR